MAGLNDDFIMADVSTEPKDAPAVTIQAFKDTPEGEVPELRDDIDLIAVACEDLYVQLRDLDLLQQNIKDHGGMNQTIALEAQALLPEFISEERPIGFFTKHPSRTLLSAALEDVGNGKKNIVQKMIDAIINFIGRILKRIKDIFIVDEEKIKADAEFAKNYKGPTDEDLIKAANKFAQDNKSQTHTAADDVTVDKTADALQDAIHRAEKITGQKVTKEKVHEFFNGEKMALIKAMLSKDRMAIVSAMMDEHFAADFYEALKLCSELVSSQHSADWDSEFQAAGNIADKLRECNEAIAIAGNESEKTQHDQLARWVMGKDYHAVGRMHDHYSDGNTVNQATRTHSATYLEGLQSELEKLQNDASSEAVENLKKIQIIVASISGFVVLVSKVSSSYNTVLKGLRK